MKKKKLEIKRHLTYIWVTKDTMSKKNFHINYQQHEDGVSNIIAEPIAMYNNVQLKKIPTVTEFTYKKFQKIADKVPFTQKEWATVLHLSERTLQRYAKGNSSFEGIYIDRILHIEQLINLGLQTFKSSDTFYQWLKTPKQVGTISLNFDDLTTSQGIQLTINLVGRILHNVYA